MNNTNPPKSKRPWYQFSLRTMLVLLIACAVFLGWRVYRARKNRERVDAVTVALAEIEKLGGDVRSEYKAYRSVTWLEALFDDPGSADDPVGAVEVSRVRFWGVSVTDADLQWLGGLTSLGWLNLDGTEITDAGLERLRGLKNLKTLSLRSTNVTDDGLRNLSAMTKLKRLMLDKTDVTSAGMRHLRELKNLNWLNLRWTGIEDDGLQHLTGLTNLKMLNLENTNITDAGLMHLKRLTNLEALVLKHARHERLKKLANLPPSKMNVTDEGVEGLQRALPNCKVYYGEGR